MSACRSVFATDLDTADIVRDAMFRQLNNLLCRMLQGWRTIWTVGAPLPPAAVPAVLAQERRLRRFGNRFLPKERVLALW